MAEGYELTVSGLLRKRAELMGEQTRLRERTATVTNYIAAIDRVLDSFGQDERALSDMRPRGTRLVLYRRNELQVLLLDQLRKADKPLSGQELARPLALAKGLDPEDRQLMAHLVKRIGGALRKLRKRGVATDEKDRLGHSHWRLVPR